MRELAKAREQFALFGHGEVTLGGEDVENVETAGDQTRHAVDARIGFARLDADIDVERNPEELSDLTFGIAESTTLLGKARADALTLLGESGGQTLKRKFMTSPS